jgi:hypothetical protein
LPSRPLDIEENMEKQRKCSGGFVQMSIRFEGDSKEEGERGKCSRKAPERLSLS